MEINHESPATFVRNLTMDMAMQEDLVEPMAEATKDDTFVGDMTDDLKRLWSMKVGYSRSADEIELKLKYLPEPHPIDELAKIAELRQKAKALDILFWIGVQDTFHLWGTAEGVACRKGWTIATVPAPKMPSISFMFPFGKFFGGDQP